jgi:hypothetical protein
MLLGALSKGMDSMGLSKPWLRGPQPVFGGLNFSAICEKVRLIKSDPWYSNHYDVHRCNVKSIANFIVDSAIAGAGGLALRKRSAEDVGAD